MRYIGLQQNIKDKQIALADGQAVGTSLLLNASALLRGHGMGATFVRAGWDTVLCAASDDPQGGVRVPVADKQDYNSLRVVTRNCMARHKTHSMLFCNVTRGNVALHR